MVVVVKNVMTERVLSSLNKIMVSSWKHKQPQPHWFKVCWTMTEQEQNNHLTKTVIFIKFLVSTKQVSFLIHLEEKHCSLLVLLRFRRVSLWVAEDSSLLLSYIQFRSLHCINIMCQGERIKLPVVNWIIVTTIKMLQGQANSWVIRVHHMTSCKK